VRILSDASLEILPLLDAAYQVRKRYFGQEVSVHILNNAQNGHCPEDCRYCAQARTSTADIEEYGTKSDEEILQEARRAYAQGASCYCMVFAGRRASSSRIEHLKRIVSQIKSEFPDKEICVSAGFVSPQGALELKQAGLDRLNHNLNTSKAYYPQICTTHTFQDRLDTLLAAKGAGLKICSGMIVGMGEKPADIMDVAKRLRALKAEAIPVNFFLPIAGNGLLPQELALKPDFVLRVLCLFRLLNPSAEIRIAAGRELYLRSLEVMALYPANSLFLQGYLNAKGSSNEQTLRMIQDAGFVIKSEVDISELLKTEDKVLLKDLKELRPTI
jgi:biotin synthase